MKNNLLIPTFTIAILALPSIAFAAVSPSSALRSAYLQREVGELQPLDRREAEEIREDLQSHFDSVLQLLEKHSDISLRVALIRLEKQQGIRWTAGQRTYWTNYLTEQRALNMQRLAAYRHRGLFPQNEGHSVKAVPIFVDRHDTACAVGHLMRESGWEREVELIETVNLFVYVTDVRNGPLVHWVLQSGLTQEEAALIQPGYPIDADHRISEFTSPGASLSSEGLVYSEFSTTAAGNLGIRAGQGYMNGHNGNELGDIDPIGTDWLLVGGETFQDNGFIHQNTNRNMTFKFRVKNTELGKSINQISIQTDYWEEGFDYSTRPQFGYDGRLWGSNGPLNQYPDLKDYFGMTAKVTNLATMQLSQMQFNVDTIDEFYNDENPNKGNGALSLSLPPGNDFLVEIYTYYDIYDSVSPPIYLSIGSYVVDFNVVPEPTSMASLSLGLVALGLCRNRRSCG